MKKEVFYSILVIVVVAVMISGGTYAYFSLSTSPMNDVDTDMSKFGIIYSGGNHVNAQMNISTNKEGGYNTTVHIRTVDGAVSPKATIYLDIVELTNNLAIDGFVWEVYKNNETTAYNHGTFNGYNDTNNNVIELVKDYVVTSTDTAFTVYFWLDGNSTDSNVLGGSFEGYIKAKTENFAAVLE